MKKKPTFFLARGVCGGSSAAVGWPWGRGFRRFLLSSVGTWTLLGKSSLRSDNLSSGGAVQLPQAAWCAQSCSPQTCPTAWAWCCVHASFPVPTEPPSLSVLTLLILCDKGRTCQPVNLPLQGEKSASCITFTSWHDLSLRGPWFCFLLCLMNKLLRTCSIHCVLVAYLLDEV